MEDGPSSTSCFRRLTDCFLGARNSSCRENNLLRSLNPFYIKICSGMDPCQGTVHNMNGETDDNLLKASVDPLSSCRGLVSEGMGKGHMHVDLLTTCPRVKAHKRTRHRRRREDLWFSLAGPRWALCGAAAEFSVTPDVERGT
ncbi:hypothetical protein PAMP_001825 [Pampus punctatissimus]